MGSRKVLSNKAHREFSVKTSKPLQCVKSVQIRSFFWSLFSPNALLTCVSRKYGPEKIPRLETFHAVLNEDLKQESFFLFILVLDRYNK